MGKVIALIVTYNRKELVSRCLKACLAQTDPPDCIFLFENGSTDGTRDYLEQSGILADQRIVYFRVSRNIGPAAAFDRLLRLAFDAGCDWVWVMDDDTIPSPEALEQLKAAFRDNFASPEQLGFLSSAIVSADGRPNNVPDIDTRAAHGECQTWGELIHRGLLKLRWSTLCSVIIPRSTLAKIGSLSPDFYFSGDDIDFALRITEVLPGYLVGKSVVTHLRQISGVFSILRETNPDRIRLFFYYYRNNLYIRRRYYSRYRTLLYIGKSAVEIARALRQRRYPLLRAASIARGVLAGMVFQPVRHPMSPTLTPAERSHYFDQFWPTPILAHIADRDAADLGAAADLLKPRPMRTDARRTDTVP
jgi:GT2 family glycosyltransferase